MKGDIAVPPAKRKESLMKMRSECVERAQAIDIQIDLLNVGKTAELAAIAELDARIAAINSADASVPSQL